MENDIDIEQITRINKQKEQNLRRIKLNIEKLQKNMAKKQQKSKQTIQISRQPTSIYNQFQNQYSSTSPINTEKQFAFNSTLFKNINNQSQPIMENRSGVSNFSSVSNINNLLNAQNKPQMMSSNYNPSIRPPLQNNLLSDIDKLLRREPKTFSSGFQKIADVRESQQNSDLSNSRPLNSSKSFLQKSGEAITPQLDEFRKLIDSLESIHQRPRPQLTHRKLAQTNQNPSNIWQREEPQQLASSIDIKQDYSRKHNKNKSSNLVQKSEYSQNYSKIPPLPSAKTFLPPQNTVQRNKAKLKESLQQFKKLSTQMINQNLQKSEIDLVFSDQDSEQQRKKEEQQIQILIKQRKILCEQLAKIDKQLQQLQKQ